MFGRKGEFEKLFGLLLKLVVVVRVIGERRVVVVEVMRGKVVVVWSLGLFHQ